MSDTIKLLVIKLIYNSLFENKTQNFNCERIRLICSSLHNLVKKILIKFSLIKLSYSLSKYFSISLFKQY